MGALREYWDGFCWGFCNPGLAIRENVRDLLTAIERRRAAVNRRCEQNTKEVNAMRKDFEWA